MPSLEESVRGALELKSSQAQHVIVDAAITQLQSIDPTASFETTGYFNHSYLPDIVARWGQSKGSGSARPYFLRFHLYADEVSEDVIALGDDHPAIVGLLPAHDDAHVDANLFVEHPTSMVIEGDALEGVAALAEEDAFAAMVPRALARSGRGYLDVSEADELTVAVTAGFEAATSGNVDVTLRTLQTLRKHLVDEQAVQLERTLGVLWLGSGAERDQFPAIMDFDSRPLPGTLRSTLEILFASAPIDREDFWDRVAGWIGPQDLIGFGDLDPCPNLSRLMAKAVTRLGFISAALTESSHGTRAAPSWAVHNAGLVLAAGNSSVHFVSDGRLHSHWPQQVESRPDWSEVKKRLGGYAVERARFESGTVSVRLDANRGLDADQQADVIARIDAMSGLGEVDDVVVRSAAGPRVRCRMGSLVATAQETKPVPAAELGWIALAIVGGPQFTSDGLKRVLDGAFDWPASDAVASDEN